MSRLFFISVFCVVLVSFLANPSPESLELADLILIGLPCLIGIFCLGAAKNYKIYQSQYNLILAIIFYLSYLLLSSLIGLAQGIPFLNVLRSIGPYINFFPLLLISFMPTHLMRPLYIGIIFILVGLLQISYLSYLYFSHSSQITTILSVLINRITFADQRTTLPLLLAVPILPVIFSLNKNLSPNKQFLLKISSICLIFLGLLAGIITLTRAIFLSMLVSWMVFIGLYLYLQSRLGIFSYAALLKKISLYFPLFIITLILISSIPQIHILEMGLLSRFYDSSYSNVDYSNGRIYDEWLPALTTWSNSGLFGFFFGIGAGNTFAVLTGEERTYIHNLCIYSLVYGGFYGLFSCIILYFTLIKTLISRAIQTRNTSYIAFSALLASMFFYGQLFAVHKGLAFNVMLFLIMALALSRPVHETESYS